MLENLQILHHLYCNLKNTSEFVKGYFDLDIAASKKINKSLTINFGIDNLLDYTDPSNILNLPGRILYGRFNLKL